MPDHTKAGADVTDAMVAAAASVWWDESDRQRISWEQMCATRSYGAAVANWRRRTRRALEAALKAAGGGM